MEYVFWQTSKCSWAISSQISDKNNFTVFVECTISNFMLILICRVCPSFAKLNFPAQTKQFKLLINFSDSSKLTETEQNTGCSRCALMGNLWNGPNWIIVCLLLAAAEDNTGRAEPARGPAQEHERLQGGGRGAGREWGENCRPAEWHSRMLLKTPKNCNKNSFVHQDKEAGNLRRF